jgi:hypothetical protein
MRRVLFSVALLAATATAAGAAECPLLQAQVDKSVGNRFDAGAANARALAAQAMQLHKDGKHADSVKKYDEAAKAAGLTLTHKK